MFLNPFQVGEDIESIIELVYLIFFHLIFPYNGLDKRKVWVFLFFFEGG